MSHHGVVSTNTHHTMLLVLHAWLTWYLRLSRYLRNRYLAVWKNLAVVSTGWNHMCNLWFSIIHSNLLLLSSILSCSTMVCLLMTICSRLLVGKLLSVSAMSVGVASMTVALAGVGVLCENWLRHLLLLHLRIIRISVRLKSKKAGSTTLHRLAKSILLKQRLLHSSTLPRAGGQIWRWISLRASNDCRSSLVVRVVRIHDDQMSLF